MTNGIRSIERSLDNAFQTIDLGSVKVSALAASLQLMPKASAAAKIWAIESTVVSFMFSIVSDDLLLRSNWNTKARKSQMVGLLSLYS